MKILHSVKIKTYMMSKKRPKTRRHILETVVKLLLSDEKSALRMIDVAKAAEVTRQTVYDHFSNRSEMLIAAVLHFGESLDVEALLAESRAAMTGEARLDAFTRAMLTFFPSISPVQRALTRLGEADQDAKAAWANRMSAMKDGCAAAIAALARDGTLNPDWTEAEATDYYFTLLGIEAWDYCVNQCGWTEAAYLAHVQRVARTLFFKPA